MEVLQEDPPCCKKQRLMTDITSGETACGSCGHVFGTEQSNGLGYRLFSDDEFVVSQNAPMDTSGKKSTVIGRSDKDYLQNTLSPDMRNLFRRLRIWDNRIESQKRSTFPAIAKIDSVMKAMGASQDRIVEAKNLFRKYTDTNFTRGHSIDESISGVLYGVFKKYGPSRIRDISRELNVKPSRITAAYTVLSKNFERELQNGNGNAQPREDSVRMEITKELYSAFDTIMSKFSAPDDVRMRIAKYAKNLFNLPDAEKFAEGKSRYGVAAATIYMASVYDGHMSLYVTQDKLSKASGVSSVSIRMNRENIEKIIGDAKYAK